MTSILHVRRRNLTSVIVNPNAYTSVDWFFLVFPMINSGAIHRTSSAASFSVMAVKFIGSEEVSKLKSAKRAFPLSSIKMLDCGKVRLEMGVKFGNE